MDAASRTRAYQMGGASVAAALHPMSTKKPEKNFAASVRAGAARGARWRVRGETACPCAARRGGRRGARSPAGRRGRGAVQNVRLIREMAEDNRLARDVEAYVGSTEKPFVMKRFQNVPSRVAAMTKPRSPPRSPAASGGASPTDASPPPRARASRGSVGGGGGGGGGGGSGPAGDAPGAGADYVPKRKHTRPPVPRAAEALPAVRPSVPPPPPALCDSCARVVCSLLARSATGCRTTRSRRSRRRRARGRAARRWAP